MLRRKPTAIAVTSEDLASFEDSRLHKLLEVNNNHTDHAKSSLNAHFDPSDELKPLPGDKARIPARLSLNSLLSGGYFSTVKMGDLDDCDPMSLSESLESLRSSTASILSEIINYEKLADRRFNEYRQHTVKCDTVKVLRSFVVHLDYEGEVPYREDFCTSNDDDDDLFKLSEHLEDAVFPTLKVFRGKTPAASSSLLGSPTTTSILEWSNL